MPKHLEGYRCGHGKWHRRGEDCPGVNAPERVAHCQHCEYDRRFPGFENGGWIQQDNNGPIVPCPVCNDDGAHPRREK